MNRSDDLVRLLRREAVAQIGRLMRNSGLTNGRLLNGFGCVVLDDGLVGVIDRLQHQRGISGTLRVIRELVGMPLPAQCPIAAFHGSD
jgi:hypothetical protein